MHTDSVQEKNRAKQPARESVPCFELKGSVITMIELRLLQADLRFFAQQLDRKVRQAADFFHQAPLALDLTEVRASTEALDFTGLCSAIQSNNLSLIGVRNGSDAQLADAKAAGLSILPDRFSKTTDPGGSPYSQSNTGSGAAGRTASPASASFSKTIYQPVRSGQQVYAKNSDLVILNSVSPGAEVIADGHIHVYGMLRGRAIAGAHGDESARIFCHSLEAELISIAGYYRVIEEIESHVKNQSVQIYLKDQRVTIEKF